MRLHHFIISICALLFASSAIHTDDNFVSKEGTVSFLSKAAFEKIKGKSTELTGNLNLKQRTFSFSMPICSFQGFVNSKQKRHYCENYVEGAKFPTASFKGKVVDDADFSVPGTYNIRAKGMFLLHGIEKEIFINGVMTVAADQITIDSKFIITLADFNMKLSKMNTLVIAKNVNVETKIVMIPG